ncbi:MAG TPA: hypothetical protein VID70_04015 [Solirubrobacteraceae bacterium]|jgi:hypothetical protein
MSTAAATLDPYVAILELSERELELAGMGRIDDLHALGEEWRALVGQLPTRPPLEARPLLERAALAHERTHAELLRLREAMLCDVRTTAQASRVAHGYAQQERRRIRRIDRSA